MPEKSPYRSGRIAIVGSPNVGKSTLLNALLGVKLAIVSSKPQTTRTRLLGIVTKPFAQLVFVDTPGLNRFPRTINRAMNREALAALEEVDAVLYMIDVGLLKKQGLPTIPEGALRRPLVLALNKVDTVERQTLLPMIAKLAEIKGVRDIVPISARKGENLDRLLQVLASHLPEGEAVYGDDELTDAPMRHLAAEMVREKAFRNLSEEVPYGVAVEVEEWTEDAERGLTTISATIVVERESQKGILIGKGGSMIKLIGTEARADIEKLVGGQVHLALRVAVEPGWTSNERRVRELGNLSRG
jgi:GTP-binding protein Era